MNYYLDELAVADMIEKIFLQINTYLSQYEPIFVIALTMLFMYVVMNMGKFANYLKLNNIKLLGNTAVINTLQVVPGGKKLLNKEKDKVLTKLKQIFPPSEVQQYTSLPTEGLKETDICEIARRLIDDEIEKWKNGTASGTIYTQSDTNKLSNTIYCMFSGTNPLHPDIFPSIKHFEASVIKMTLNLFNAPESGRGVMTSGGTESILLAMKAYRDYRSDIKYPEIIVPESAHAAFDKAGHYFRIKVVKIPVGNDYKADTVAMEKAITRNTLCIVGSAISYPHGMLDNIVTLSKIAQRHQIGLHVDCCLGGFVLPFQRKTDEYGDDLTPFDFALQGVTSISADTHKFAMAPKGTSVLMFRTGELRQNAYFTVVDWSGGLYATPTLAGSRPGGLVAGCWATMVKYGENGYIEITEKILEEAMAIKNGIKESEDYQLIGDPISCVIAFTAVKLNIYKIADAMSGKGWHLNVLQKPPAIHICLTARSAENKISRKFLRDLELSAFEVFTHPKKYNKMASIYGMTSTMPKGTLHDFTRSYLDAVLD